MEVKLQKDQIRKEAKDIRKKCVLSAEAATVLKENVLPFLEPNKIIAGYEAMHSELDLSYLGLSLLYPIIQDDSRILLFESDLYSKLDWP